MQPTRGPVNETFAPPGEKWESVSPKLATAYRISLGLVTLLVVIVIVALAFVPEFPRALTIALLVATVIVATWASWLVGRRTRSWGYAERTDDLLVTRGIVFRRLVIVPYGRMQLVDVTAGPIHRMLGITTEQLHTAAATTDAAIPGLTPQVAADLRDRLIGEVPDAEAAHLDKAGQRGGGADQQAGTCGFDVNPVVADQPDEGQGGCLDQVEGQTRFAATGGPANQHGLGADQDGGGVEGGDHLTGA